MLDLMHGDWNTVVISCVVTLADALCVTTHVVPVVSEATVCKFFVSSALIPHGVAAAGARKWKDGSLKDVTTVI